MKLKRKAVMLPTNKKANDSSCMALDTQLNKLLSAKEYLVTHFNSNDRFKTQHLYILSDEEIKVGDWYFDECLDKPRKCITDNKEYWAVRKNYKKIIATTDKSLELPEPPPEFIDKFIREYNKGNVIQNVMVEYDAYNRSTTWEYDESEIIELKVDKNNYITITREKESWSREEVIEFVYKVLKAAGKEIKAEMVDISTHPHIIFTGVDEWIEENL